MKSALYASVAALALCGAAAPASATTYAFSFDTSILISGSNVSASGTFTVPDGGGFVEDLEAASGTINGSAITGFTAGSEYLFGGNNGLLDAGFTTASGITYTYNAGTYSSTDGDFGRAAFTATAVSAVPLPAGLPMFGAALLGLGAVGFGLKRSRKAVLPA